MQWQVRILTGKLAYIRRVVLNEPVSALHMYIGSGNCKNYAKNSLNKSK